MHNKQSVFISMRLMFNAKSHIIILILNAMKNLTTIGLMPFEKPDTYFNSNYLRAGYTLLNNPQQTSFTIKNIIKTNFMILS